MKYFTILIILISLSIGCITKRGTKVDMPSSGTVITPSELIRQPNGTYKIKQKKTEIPPGIPYNPSENKVTVTDLPIPKKSIAPKPKPVEPKTTQEKLPVAPTPSLIAGDGGCVKTGDLPTDNKSKTAGEPEIAEDAPVVKVRWGELWMFYLTAALVLVTGWMAYKTIREVREHRQQKRTQAAKKTNKRQKSQPKTKK